MVAASLPVMAARNRIRLTGQLLRPQAIAAHAAGEDTFTYGVLYQREDGVATGAHDQLDEALKVLDKAVRKA